MGILETIKLKLILEQPFFGNLLMHIKFKEDKDVNGMGTNGIDIFYNEASIKEMSTNQISFLIMHQIMHIILFHVFRGIDYKDDELFHRASDMVANSIVMSSLDYCDRERLSELNIEHTIIFEEASNYTVEQVYNKLKQNEEEKKNSLNNGEGDEFLDSESENKKSFCLKNVLY